MLSTRAETSHRPGFRCPLLREKLRSMKRKRKVGQRHHEVDKTGFTNERNCLLERHSI